MPAINLTTLSHIPYAYSATTPSSTNTCQLVQVPTNVQGLALIIHNRDKASKALRVSFDPALTQDGAAPSLYFSIGEPLELRVNHSAASGFQPSPHIAFFSDSSSVNFEIIFRPG